MTLLNATELLKVTRLQERILWFLLDKDSYAVEIRNAIFDVTDGQVFVGDGTLYPALQSLEQANFLESYMNDHDLQIRGGYRRKMYTITAKGKVVLEREDILRHKLKCWQSS